MGPGRCTQGCYKGVLPSHCRSSRCGAFPLVFFSRETSVANMLSLLQTVSLLCLASQSALAANFPFERVTLKESDVKNNKDLAFGKLPVSPVNKARCKTYASDANWPTGERWNAFNSSLGGALIKGIPPAAACYEGPYQNPAKCETIRATEGSTNFVYVPPIFSMVAFRLTSV